MKLRITKRTTDAAMKSPAVRAELRRRAERTLPKVRAIAYSANAQHLAKSLRVTEGTRPGTGSRLGISRPYARVEGDSDPATRRADRRAGAKLTHLKIMRRGGAT